LKLQLALRQVAFRQIYKVLGMSKPIPMGPRFKPGPSPGKKRPRENSQSEAVSPEGKPPLIMFDLLYANADFVVIQKKFPEI